MMQVTSDQWLSWLSLYFWPLLRVLALISTAPILSERSVPKRVKLGLAMMITFAIAPSLPANDVPVFSFFALWLAVQQILIGIALGFTMQFAFAAVRTAGEIIGLQMGLSFATFVDPASHLNMPVKENQTPCFGECQKRIAVQRFATNWQGVKGIDQQ